jgi:hypothetical protein
VSCVLDEVVHPSGDLSNFVEHKFSVKSNWCMFGFRGTINIVKGVSHNVCDKRSVFGISSLSDRM